jgi:5,10-methylenetetrahydromethanopterin reductase
MPDSQVLWRDVWITLAAAAMNTTSIRLATGVTNPITRHESVTVAAARSLNELSHGRFDLGLGIGESAVNAIGLPRASLERLRTFIIQIKPLLTATEHSGPRESSVAAPLQTVPIFLAATGPLAMELGGELADGVLLDVAATPEAVNSSLDRIRRGALRRPLGSVIPHVVLVMFARTGESPTEVRRWARSLAAIRSLAKGRAIPNSSAGPRDLARLTHEQDLDRLERETGWVTEHDIDEFLAERCLPSSPPEISSLVGWMAAAGVDEIFLRALDPQALPDGLCETLGSEAFRSLRDSGGSRA